MRSRIHRRSGREHAEMVHHPLLLGTQRVPAPFDGLTKAAASVRPRSSLEHRESIAESVPDLDRVEHCRSTCRQFDAQRKTIERCTELGHAVAPLVDVQFDTGAAGTIEEQLHRCTGAVGRERHQRNNTLRLDAESFATRRQDSDVRTSLDDTGEHIGRRSEDLLTVVEHQQVSRVSECGDQRIQRVDTERDADTERGGGHDRDPIGLADRREIHEAAVPVWARSCHGGSDPGLADTGRAEHCHESVLVEQPHDLLHHACTSDERGRLVGQLGESCVRGTVRSGEKTMLELGGRDPWHETRLRQCVARLPQDAQRQNPFARQSTGVGQRHPDGLVERSVLDASLEERDRRRPPGERNQRECADTPSIRGALVQSSTVGHHVIGCLQCAPRFAAPTSFRLLDACKCRSGVGPEGGIGCDDLRLEALPVRHDMLTELVAGPAGRNEVIAVVRSQTCDHVRERLPSGRRLIEGRPDSVDQRLRRQRCVTMQRQRREHHLGSFATCRQPASTGPHADRAELAEFDRLDGCTHGIGAHPGDVTRPCALVNSALSPSASMGDQPITRRRSTHSAMYGLLITFRSSIALDDLTQPFADYANVLCNVPGLLTKAWISDGDVLGGFHVFENEEGANGYLASGLATDLRATDGFDDFEVRGFEVLDELSAVTGLSGLRPLSRA